MGHLETLSQCAPKLSQGTPSLSQGAPKVSQGAPTFSGTVTSSISQQQALAIGIFSIQILILGSSMLSSGTVPNVVFQGTPGGVSRCPSMGYIETFFLKICHVKK